MINQLVHKRLIKKKLTISVAESCTGGLLAHNLTKLANSSKYFQMGLTTYSNQAKIKILKVNKNIIRKYGAVSHECCKVMVQNLSKISKRNQRLHNRNCWTRRRIKRKTSWSCLYWHQKR